MPSPSLSSLSPRLKSFIPTTYWAVFLGSLLLVMSLLQTGENGYALIEVDAMDEHKPLLIHQAIVSAIGLILGAWALFFWKFEKVTSESVNTFALTVGLGAAYTLFVIIQQHRYYVKFISSEDPDRAEHIRNVMYGNVILFSIMTMLMILLVFYGWN